MDRVCVQSLSFQLMMMSFVKGYVEGHFFFVIVKSKAMIIPIQVVSYQQWKNLPREV